MERITLEPRADWRRRAEEIGFAFAEIEGEVYWDETACYRFGAEEIDALEEATGELEQLCLRAVDLIISHRAYDRLRIPPAAVPLIEASWRNGHRNMYGRFDLRYDGQGPPKLLEYNADTPTALFEASVVQWEWLETLFPEADQYNSIHEKLIEAWGRFGLRAPMLHFACARDSAEDWNTTEYLRDTATQAGLRTAFLHMDEIGWDGRQFLDLDHNRIQALFKLYPWEWMMQEEFAQHLPHAGVQVIEPAWKMLLSTKAILPILWEMFPEHPNLLPAFFERGRTGGPEIEKPILGREGANISVEGAGGALSTDGPYGAEGFVYQAYQELPRFGGRYPVLGSWVVASQPCGMGIREDDGPITRNTSRFVPHYFE